MIPSDDLAFLSEAIGLELEDSVLLEREGHFYQRTLPLVLSTIRAFIRGFTS
jgi:hypothetical protein